MTKRAAKRNKQLLLGLLILITGVAVTALFIGEKGRSHQDRNVSDFPQSQARINDVPKPDQSKGSLATGLSGDTLPDVDLPAGLKNEESAVQTFGQTDDLSGLAAKNERTVNGYPYDAITEDVYSVFSNSNLQNVAFIEGVECGERQCEIDVHFFDSSSAGISTSEFINDMNQRFQADAETPSIQMALSSIGRNESGDYTSNLVVLPYEQPTYEVEIGEQGSMAIKYIGGDK